MAARRGRARMRGLNWRIAAAFSPMLLPLAAGAVAALLLFGATVDHFDATVKSASAETIAIVGVKAGLGPTGSAAFAPTIMNGAPRADYEHASAAVDDGFADLFTEQITPAVRTRLEAGHRAWLEAKGVVTSVFALPVASRMTLGLARMQTFVADITATERQLAAAESASEARLRVETAAAKRSEHEAVRDVILAMGLALVVGAVLARVLARSVLKPVHALRVGAERLSAGELSYRVGLDRRDELGAVADAFDAMATTLEGAQSELRHRALHDALTGLPNRTLLLDRLTHALTRCARHGGMLALLLVDLDGFKAVNDTFGHAAGDEVLVGAGRRITELLRVSDTAARLGGDEFAVLLEDLAGDDEATAVADRVVAALSEPFVVGDVESYLGGSVGLVVSGNGLDRADELLRNADLAMYSAKQAGRGRSERFADAMHEAAMERLGLEADLRRAIDRGELVVHYQPTVELATGRITGVEALVRWEHPELGLVAPMQFIPLAEETGLVIPLGRVVLESACRQVKEWTVRHPELADLSLHVNVSARQLDHPDLVAEVIDVLDRTGYPASALTLEITETVLSRAETASRLHELKDLGLRIAMDDFGTGYSSLGYLQRFPIDVLKIDRSFVERLGHGDGNMSLALAVVMLARSLGLTTVAEGIEDDEQLTVLRLIGCKHGQGFYFARPLEAVAAEALLVERALTASTGGEVDERVGTRAPVRELSTSAAGAVTSCSAVIGEVDVVALADRDGALLYASPSASELLGYDIDEKLDTNILDLVHPDDLNVVLAGFVATVANPGLREPIACRLRHADGSTRRVTVIAVNLLEDPDVGAVVFAVRFADAILRTGTDG